MSTDWVEKQLKDFYEASRTCPFCGAKDQDPRTHRCEVTK